MKRTSLKVIFSVDSVDFDFSLDLGDFELAKLHEIFLINCFVFVVTLV